MSIAATDIPADLKGDLHHVEDFGDEKQHDTSDTEARGQDVDPAVEKKLVRKLDRYIVPVVGGLYLFSALDRANIGNAAGLGLIGARGLPADPHGKKFAFFNAMFYIMYAVCMIPLSLLGRKIGKPYLSIPIAAMVWGAASACTAAATSWSGAYAARGFLGIGEAGFQPLVPYLLTTWYTGGEIAQRLSFYYITGAVSGVINGLIAYGLSFTHSSVAPWQLLFIIEGVCTFTFAWYAIWALPTGLHKARHFTAEELEIARIRKSRSGKVESHQDFRWKQALNVVISWPILLPSATNMCCLTVGAAISAFLPTLIAQQGYKGAIAQLYTLPAYGTGGIMMLLCARLSDKTGRRAPFIAFSFCLTILGCAMLKGISPTNDSMHRHARYAALVFMANAGLIVIPLNMTWVAENAGNDNRRAIAFPLFSATGQAVAACSGYLFPADQGPKYTMGVDVCLALGTIGLGFTIVYVFLCEYENRKRDRREGPPDPNVIMDTLTYGDKAVGFRYKW